MKEGGVLVYFLAPSSSKPFVFQKIAMASGEGSSATETLRKNGRLVINLEFSLCLSRACLGKKMTFIYKCDQFGVFRRFVPSLSWQFLASQIRKWR
jgi:hypothetical protein